MGVTALYVYGSRTANDLVHLVAWILGTMITAFIAGGILHELTHILAVKLAGGRIQSIGYTKNGIEYVDYEYTGHSSIARVIQAAPLITGCTAAITYLVAFPDVFTNWVSLSGLWIATAWFRYTILTSPEDYLLRSAKGSLNFAGLTPGESLAIEAAAASLVAVLSLFVIQPRWFISLGLTSYEAMRFTLLVERALLSFAAVLTVAAALYMFIVEDRGQWLIDADDPSDINARRILAAWYRDMRDRVLVSNESPHSDQ